MQPTGLVLQFPHVSSAGQRMFSGNGQLVGVAAQSSAHQKRVKEFGNFVVDGLKAQLFCVEDDNLFSKSVEEVQSSLIQRTGAAFAHQNDKRSLAVSDFKRAVEILARMNRGRVDPLHLHQQADSEGISNTVRRARTHGVDEFLVFVHFRPFLSSGSDELSSVANDFVNSVKAVVHLIVVLVTLGLIQDLNSQFQRVALAAVSGRTFLRNQNIVAVLSQRRFGFVGDNDRSRASFLSDLSSFYSLRSVTGSRLGDNDRMFAQRLRGSMAELVGAVMIYFQLFALALQEIFTRMQASVRTAASNKVYALDGAFGFQDFSNNRFRTSSHWKFLLINNRQFTDTEKAVPYS